MTYILITFPWGFRVVYPSWETVHSNRHVLSFVGATAEEVETLPEDAYTRDPDHFENWVENDLAEEISRD